MLVIVYLLVGLYALLGKIVTGAIMEERKIDFPEAIRICVLWPRYYTEAKTAANKGKEKSK